MVKKSKSKKQDEGELMNARDFLTGLHCLEADEDDHDTSRKKRYFTHRNNEEDEMIDRIDRTRGKQ